MKEWWSKLPDTWKTITVIAGAVGLIIGTYRTIDATWTKRCDFDQHAVSNKMDLAEVSEATKKGFIQQDLRWNAQQQYEVKKSLRANPRSESDHKRLEELQLEKEQMERELMELKKKKGG